jgi:NADPH:quinone reductase-like Zn-dependent oxidoreductase
VEALIGFLNVVFYFSIRLRFHDLVRAAAGLRGRSLANKAQIVSEVEKNVWPAVAAGKVKPVIYKTFPLSEAAEAHRLMETSSHIGKILLLP